MKKIAEILNEILNLNGLVGVTLIKDEKSLSEGVETLKEPFFIVQC